MDLGKRCAIMFLAGVNIINIIAGVITQYKLIIGEQATLILPLKVNLSQVGVLMVNLLSVITVFLLINIVTTYLATDVAYSPIEIMENCAGVFLVLPVIISAVGLYNAVKSAPSDRIFIIVMSVIYVLFFAVDVACMLTIKQDSKE